MTKLREFLSGLHKARSVALDFTGATLAAVGVGGWVNVWAGMITAAAAIWALNLVHNDGDG